MLYDHLTSLKILTRERLGYVMEGSPFFKKISNTGMKFSEYNFKKKGICKGSWATEKLKKNCIFV